MKPEFYDTHAHLDFPDFQNELPEVIARAQTAGVTRIVTIGTTLESSRRAIEIAEQYSCVSAAVGWHPAYIASAPRTIGDDLRVLAQHPKVVAIGEIGLDYSRLPSAKGGSAADDQHYREKQRESFVEQLTLAAELNQNVIIHQRQAFDDVLELLRPFCSRLKAVFHCFVGTPEERQKVTELGCIVSFTGIVTFKNATTVHETLRATPLGSLMLETDCPFLAPVPHRGKRCEPAFVAQTADFIAREKSCSLDELSESTSRTAEQFFRWSVHS